MDPSKLLGRSLWRLSANFSSPDSAESQSFLELLKFFFCFSPLVNPALGGLWGLGALRATPRFSGCSESQTSSGGWACAHHAIGWPCHRPATAAQHVAPGRAAAGLRALPTTGRSGGGAATAWGGTGGSGWDLCAQPGSAFTTREAREGGESSIFWDVSCEEKYYVLKINMGQSKLQEKATRGRCSLFGPNYCIWKTFVLGFASYGKDPIIARAHGRHMVAWFCHIIRCVKMNLRPCKPQNSSTKPLQNLKGDKEISSTPPCWYQHLPRPVRCCFISAGPDPGTLFYPLPHMGGKVFIPAQPNENGKMLGLKNPQQGPSHCRLVYGAPWALEFALGLSFSRLLNGSTSPIGQGSWPMRSYRTLDTMQWLRRPSETPAPSSTGSSTKVPNPLGMIRPWSSGAHCGVDVDFLRLSCAWDVVLLIVWDAWDSMCCSQQRG